MKRWGGRSWTMRQTLLGLFLLVMLCSSLVVAALMLFWRLPMIQQQNEAEQRRAVGIAAYHIDIHLQYAEQAAQALARSIERGHSAPGDAQQALALLLLGWSQQTGLFQGLYLLDRQARVRELQVADDLARRAAEWRGNDFSGLAALRQVRQQGRALWSDQYRSPVLERPVVAYIIPLAEGYLLVELGLDRLAAAVHESAVLDGLMVLVTDRKGEVVAAPDMRWVGLRRNISNWPVLQAALQGLTMHAAMEVDDSSYIGTAQRLERLGWVVLAGYPKAQVQATGRAAVGVSIVTLSFAVLIGVLLFWNFTGAVKRRLERSLDFTAAVAQGRYETPLPQTALVELDALSQGLQHMAQTVRNREAQLRAITESTPTVAIQWFDRDGRVLDWNPASEALLGWSREEAVGKTLDQLIYTAADHAWCLGVLHEMERTGLPFGPHEGVVLKRLKEPVWVLSTTFAIPRPEGGVTFVSMDVDISARRALEAELRQLNAELEERVAQRTQKLSEAIERLENTRAQLVQSEKLASLGALVAGVAHELNTPVGNALMSASTLEHKLGQFRQRLESGLRKSDLDAFVTQVGTGIDIALRNLQRAAELLSSFKQVAVDQTSSQRRPFSLAEVLHEVVLTLQPTFKNGPVRVSVQVPQDVQMDSFPGPLGQVLTNLIQNAVTHAFADQAPGRIEVMAQALGESEVEIVVRDNGVGIAPEHIERVFDPFFTTRLGQGGSGLGLHIAHNIVTAVLGGRMSVANGPAGGAEFKIVCPLQAPTQTGA